MCLITKKKRSKVLKKDIIGYKILKENLSPFYRGGDSYEINKLYQTKLKQSKTPFPADEIVELKYNINNICKHAYRGYNNIMYKETGLKVIGQGFHFCTTIERILSKEGVSESASIYSVIIPKGSKVYFDETNMGVADQIIIHDII